MQQPDGGVARRLRDSPRDGRCSEWRNWSGFWLLGLCNNFAYVVMLSAAHDILREQQTGNATAPVSAAHDILREQQTGNATAPSAATLDLDLQDMRSSNGSRYDCNPISTAAVLLADILPTLLIKLTAPFVIHKLPYGLRVLFCVAMAVSSFIIVSLSSAVWTSILGVIFASVSSGLGELSFLSLSVFFSRDVLGGWGSGTGGAGVGGAFLYSGLTQVGLSPQLTLQIMLVVPFIMLVSYFGLLVVPPSLPQWRNHQTEHASVSSEERRCLTEESEEEEQEQPTPAEGRGSAALSLKEKLLVIKGLLKFVIPLGLVYFAEYFINQGLMELLYFPNFFLTHAQQYRWYQMLYQVGVFVSRSSLCCVKIKKLWLLSLLQAVNAVVLVFAVRYQFLPSAWMVFAIILYEGLLGGAAYVNTFYFISKETEERHREFAMAAASVGDSLGIALAGLAAFPVHRYFCSL